LPGLKDINSTEKLLNVIRGKNEKFVLLDKKESSPFGKKPLKKTKMPWVDGLFDKKNTVVGVDIGKNFIGLVKTDKSNNSWLGHKIIQYDSSLSMESAEFKSLLKSSIMSFCGSTSHCEIWTKILSDEVNVYFIKIPRVPKNQRDNVIFWTAKKKVFR